MANEKANILSSPIEYLKGVGPQRAELLKKELGIFSFNDLLQLFPYRHIDKTVITSIKDITPETDYIQVAGKLHAIETPGDKRFRRLRATITDATGSLELVWFQGINWIQKSLIPGQQYLVFGRVGYFNGLPQISHPELEPITPDSSAQRNFLEPVYPSTEKLKARGLGGRQIAKLTHTLFTMLGEKDIPENLPASVSSQLHLINRYTAFSQIHFPPSLKHYEQALKRL